MDQNFGCSYCGQTDVLNDIDDITEHECFRTYNTDIHDILMDENKYISIAPKQEDEGKEKCDYESQSSSKNIWCRDSILCLISLYAKHLSSFKCTTLRNETVWSNLSEDLRQQGYNYTTNQARDKFKYLKLKYSRKLDSMKANGTGSIKFDYFEEMNNIFRKKPNEERVEREDPIEIITSPQIKFINVDNINECTEVMSLEETIENPPKKRKRNAASTIEEFLECFKEQSKKRAEQKERHHQEKMMLMRKVGDTIIKYLEKNT